MFLLPRRTLYLVNFITSDILHRHDDKAIPDFDKDWVTVHFINDPDMDVIVQTIEPIEHGNKITCISRDTYTLAGTFSTTRSDEVSVRCNDLPPCRFED